MLPLGLSIIHYALYINDNELLEKVLDFAADNNLYIQPGLDIFNQSPFHLAQRNRHALRILIDYYRNPKILKDANLNQGSEIFVEFLPFLIKERIPNLDKFLDARIFNALGE